MKPIQIAALSILVFVAMASLAADFLPWHDYATQFREHADEGPSRSFPLGTDELGRDRMARLLHGTRVSLLLAPAAAGLAVAAGTIIGIAAGYTGRWLDRLGTSLMDVFLSLPWLFALLTLRALLPLNISPWASLTTTFVLLALVGWASGARVVRASVMSMREAPPLVQARAYGCSSWRLLWIHVLPNLKPVLIAQFWILVPGFLLTEANLGVLGLGVTEPMPSLGNMLMELQNYERIPESPWILTPALLLVLIVSSLYVAVSGAEIRE